MSVGRCFPEHVLKLRNQISAKSRFVGWLVNIMPTRVENISQDYTIQKVPGTEPIL